MCGMKIVSVGTDAKGNINIEELRKAAETHKDNLSALMVQLASYRILLILQTLYQLIESIVKPRHFVTIAWFRLNCR